MASYEQNANNKQWSVRFRLTTITGTINKRLSGYKTKKAAQQGYIDYVNENALIQEKKYDLLTVNEVILSLRAYNKSRTKESTQYEIKNLQEKFIKPIFGDKLIKDITKTDIIQ